MEGPHKGQVVRQTFGCQTLPNESAGLVHQGNTCHDWPESREGKIQPNKIYMQKGSVGEERERENLRVL